MLHYPKIPSSRNCPTGKCVAFEKYDGTNLHWGWDRDFGWHAFGTRRDSFNLTPQGVEQFAKVHAQLHEAPILFQATLAEVLERIFLDHPTYHPFAEFKVFTEFLGPNSFAGLHCAADPKELVLFDVDAGTFGILGPEQFLADFGQLRSARMVYQGKLTGKFTEDVRRGRCGVAEGVICKGGSGGDDLWMCKIKTDANLERLQRAFAERWEDFWE